jgi:acyl transferase domain-containing protein
MSEPDGIAIVGMSCRFPGADGPDAFWRNLAEGVESITRLTDAELRAAGVPEAWLADPSYVKAAPLLAAPDELDAGFFGLAPIEARMLDPQQRLLLELAHEALEHAGYGGAGRGRGPVGVFAGAALNTYFTAMGLGRRLAHDYIPTLVASDKDFLATRVSYELDLRGPSITVQTACSTSLVAVHLACQSLLSEESDMALAGAVAVRVPHRAGYFCDGGGVTSPDGRVRAFAAGANGTVFGSGGGIVVLKRLADALADGDTIHAVIRGSAVNNDGSGKAGYTAPSVDAQAEAFAEALANAGLEADSLGYVEAHGSGTPLGDPIEVRALTKAFRAHTQRTGFCALGSVKTNVGHLDAAAGMAGLIKVVLSLAHGRLPPSLHFDAPNPEIDFASTPFRVHTQFAEWPGPGPRRAGVVSTGMGGTNATVVLEQAPPVEASAGEAPPHLLVLSARSEAALDRATEQLREFLERTESASLPDVAFTLQTGRRAFAHRRQVVCADREDAIAALGGDGRRAVSSHTSDVRRPLVLLLPGIGDHYPGMGRDLYEQWPSFRDEVDRCSHLLEPHLGLDLRTVLYPPRSELSRGEKTRGIDLKAMLARDTAETPDPERERLNRTLYAQPALFTIEYATARLWQSLGVAFDALVGHSMGEYVAACLAGVLSLEDALQLVAARARLVDGLPRGSMLAACLPEDELLAYLGDELSISLINGPRLCVVAGPAAPVAELERELASRDVICRRVQGAHAFHSRMLDPIAAPFEREVRRVRLREPALPYVSNVTGTWITREQATDPVYWARHATHTARFDDALSAMWRLEDPVLLEAGPGRTLGVLALQHPGSEGVARPTAVSSIRPDYQKQSDVETLWQAIGALWLAGVDVRWDAAPSAAERRRVPLPTYPFERERHWLEPRYLVEGEQGRPATIDKRADPREWLYVPSWKRVLPRDPRVSSAAGRESAPTWLVFADDSGLADVVRRRLEASGHGVVTARAGRGFARVDASTFTLEPGSAQDMIRLIRALREAQALPQHIVHALGVDALPEAERFAVAKARGFYGLIHLARALAAEGVREELELFVLSTGIQDVHGREPLSPEKSTLLGPCLVIGQEYPNVTVKSIDVDAQELEHDLEPAADLVTGELFDPDAHLLVAHRAGQRWVATYERLALADSVARGPAFRQRGVYLITGGLGRIGIALASHLAERYAARLVLVGRGAAPAGAIEGVEGLGGEVLYVRADVSDEPAMREAVERTLERFGELHGVIHAAGIVGERGFCEIEQAEPDRCEPHFAAKAEGLCVLERVLEGRTLDFCLLTSSLSSVLGGIGQSAYAASNIYMDTFARRHDCNSPARWSSVNWDVWRLDADALGGGMGATLDGLGLSAAEGTAMLETLLGLGRASQIVVSTGDLDARIEQWVQLSGLEQAPGARDAEASRADRAAPADPPRSKTEELVARIWQEALGFDAIGVHESFASLGGHSLLAVRIVAELRRAFQIDLPVRAIFDTPTVAELSRSIEERIVAQIEGLSDEEAQKLA